MRRASFCAAGLLIAAGLLPAFQAAEAVTILPVRDGRFVERTGEPDPWPDPPTVPVSITPLSPFGDFSTSTGLYGYIAQDSTIDAKEMSAYAQAVSDGGGGTVGRSVFEVDFRVSAATDFELSGSVDARTGQSMVPVSENGGISLLADGTEMFGQDAAGSFALTGQLDPGTLYTLSLFVQTTGEPHDYADFSLAFAVPEPSPAALALATLLLLTLRLATRGRPSEGPASRSRS